MAVILLFGIYLIEQLHTQKEKKNKDISKPVQDEKEHNREFKITKEQYVLSILILLMSIGIGFFGNLFANCFFSQFGTDFICNTVFILFFGFIVVLIYLAYEKLYPKN